MKLDLTDLQPKEATLCLSERPEKTYTLSKISLRVRIWLKGRFNKEQIDGIFEDQKLPELSEIAYFLLKDKADFPSLEIFQDAIVTQADFQALITALLQTVGISEPMIDKLKEGADMGNELSPPIGDPSST